MGQEDQLAYRQSISVGTSYALCMPSGTTGAWAAGHLPGAVGAGPVPWYKNTILVQASNTAILHTQARCSPIT